MTPKEKAKYVYDLCSGLTLGTNKSYALTYVWQVLNRNPDLTTEKREFWKEVKKELENY